jgi:glycosyltransferase involved in cell wall biosynthesis
MNKVLIICSNFLPVRNGGTIRCEKLAKYLPEYGWETVVLTKEPSKKEKLDYIFSLNYCKIYRTKSLDVASAFVNFRFIFKNFFNKFSFSAKGKITARGSLNTNSNTKVKRRIADYFLVPDADIFWAIGAITKGIYILKNEKPQIILSSGPSHSVHIIGLILKKISQKKWIIEFRDPWTMNPFNIAKPYKLLTIIDNYLEKVVIRNADRINVTSEEYKHQFLNKYKFIADEKIVQIPNGYDPEDFDSVTFNEKKKFTIVHTGNFYQHRSSSIFIAAILYLFQNETLDSNDVLVKFIGLLDEKGRNIIANSDFIDNFQLTGQVPHQESIGEICNADLLLLIPGPGEGTMPGKFYEYLAASKPIFCIVNEGPAKDIIIKHHLGVVSSDNDITEIANKLRLLIEDIYEGKFIYPNVEELKQKFNRKKIAGQMAGIFYDEVKSN